MIQKIKNKLISYILHDPEQVKILKWIESNASKNDLILDVGCGHGRLMGPLVERKFNVIGLEKNKAIVKTNKEKGLSCYTPEEWPEIEKKADFLILSHIIEHFPPQELLEFLNFYLSFLKPDGHLLVATPLYSEQFYDDFDHVRPYQPIGLKMLFESENSQVQYYGGHKLELKNLWFRKAPYHQNFLRGRYIPSKSTSFIRLADVISTFCYQISGGHFGKKNGWLGLYQKINK